ncbi:Cytochrome P450 83B1 [Spatholobus suberectus]|nr:Cytochrome P450 83B1 [Spatholobus suberectus]
MAIDLILANNLLYSFDWELPAGMKKEDIAIEVLSGLTQHKKNPLCFGQVPYVKAKPSCY